MSTDLDETGPIDYLVVEFPGNKMTGEGFPLLVDLVDAGIIRILDLVFATRDTDGTITVIDISDIDGDGQLDLAIFQGAASGLLGSDDIDEATSILEPGNSAGILVYENVWAAPFAAALRRGGAQLVASGRIPVQAILGVPRRRRSRQPRLTATPHPLSKGLSHARSDPRGRPHRRRRRNRHRRLRTSIPTPTGTVGRQGTGRRSRTGSRSPTRAR